MVFVATVVSRALPREVKLSLAADGISMRATDTFRKLSEDRTKSISEEIFTFSGVFRRIVGFFARRSIAAAHRRHMESFKRFAESQAA